MLHSGHATVPPMERVEKCEPCRQQILELLNSCKGNLVRVLEELAAQGAELSFSALMAYCRRHEIGQRRITKQFRLESSICFAQFKARPPATSAV